MLTKILDNLPSIPWQDKIAYLSYQFSLMEQSECPLKHIFEDGKYIREMTIPADTFFIGRHHIHGHGVELVSGTVINCEAGSQTEISQPFKFVSQPGYQAVFYAVTEVIGRTIHDNPDGITDWIKLEDRDFAPASDLIGRGALIAKEIEEKLICQE